MKRLLFILLIGLSFNVATVDAKEMRIVSLMPSNTEIIYALDLLEQVVGVTTSDSYPEALEDMEVARLDVMMLDVETLITLEPTHIIAHEIIMTSTEDILEQVKKNIDVEILVVEDAIEVVDIAQSIESVGEFLNVEAASVELSEDFLESLDAIADAEALGKEVLVFVSMAPEIYTVGRETFIDSALEVLGLENTFHEIRGYRTIGKEDILMKNPDYAVNITSMDDSGFSESIEELRLTGLAINDVSKQCTIDPDLLARPSIRIIEGLKELSECLDE